MPKARHLSKEEILKAMEYTKSIRATARYLNCSYQHIKKWMKVYQDNETGKSLFEAHKNRQGKGIPKFLSQTPYQRKKPVIKDLLEGRVDASSFTPQKIKREMLKAGYLKEECHNCGFNEHRLIDHKMPLIMAFKDGNKQHYGMDNVYMLCYNCYFLLHGNVFEERDLEQMEEHKTLQKTTKAVNLELDPFQIKRLKELNLWDEKEDPDDPYSLVSRKEK